MNTITWRSQHSGKSQTVEIGKAVFLLNKDGRGVDRINLRCDYGARHRYEVALRNDGSNHLRGQFEKFEQPSKSPIRTGTLSCDFFDSDPALLKGTSHWIDDDDYEWDWEANLETIERVPFEEWQP